MFAISTQAVRAMGLKFGKEKGFHPGGGFCKCLGHVPPFLRVGGPKTRPGVHTAQVLILKIGFLFGDITLQAIGNF